MFEIMAVLTLIAGGFLLVAVLAALGFFLKLTFKLVLLPFWLVGVLLKGLLLFVGLILAIVLAPIILVVILALLPLAALAGLVGVGVWVAA